MGHIGFIIPLVFHFLSRLRSLLALAHKKRVITIIDVCKKDLELMLTILEKAKNGIDMNLLAFRSPDQIYYILTPVLLASAATASRSRLALPNSRQPTIPRDEQPAGILSSDYHPVDRHHQWTPPPRGRCIINDQQHNGRRLDAKVKFQQGWRQPHPSKHASRRSEEIRQRIHERRGEGIQSVV